MEDNCQFASSRRPWLCCWLFVIPILSSAMVARGEPALSTPAEAPDDGSSLLCIAECSTCPVTCAPPSPPPPPLPDDRSLLCISKCDTCPVICTPPPPPSSSSPPPPSRATPPPSKPAPPAPEEGQRGGLSYPYYYFYTSEGTRCRGLHGILGLVPLLLTSLPLLLR
ncbi:hypothetical protein B296_00043401 [Ensete ventricosum]|uniref:4Fe-4S ferredoxin-type domain-containing protein n=1 Tax=Ensete ventricosum TaxID=4639 RepID=A0A426ZEM2_ENSVE|nr:hypothetical protein B296_00043401 [Ensete ventricosum]